MVKKALGKVGAGVRTKAGASEKKVARKRENGVVRKESGGAARKKGGGAVIVREKKGRRGLWTLVGGVLGFLAVFVFLICATEMPVFDAEHCQYEKYEGGDSWYCDFSDVITCDGAGCYGGLGFGRVWGGLPVCEFREVDGSLRASRDCVEGEEYARAVRNALWVGGFFGILGAGVVFIALDKRVRAAGRAGLAVIFVVGAVIVALGFSAVVFDGVLGNERWGYYAEWGNWWVGVGLSVLGEAVVFGLIMLGIFSKGRRFKGK